jgi:hypothetical protein
MFVCLAATLTVLNLSMKSPKAAAAAAAAAAPNTWQLS